MWKHKTKWLVRGGRKVRCYLCGKKILAKGDLFLFHGDTGYYSHQSCQAESTTISGNERRRAVKKIAVGAAVVGAIAAGAGKLIDISSQSKGSNSPAAQTILTSQGLIPPALTSDPANPVPGQMWYRSDAGVEAHFDGVQNRVVYSSEINDGNVHVTSKGIVNGLSVLPNDGTGWFGPDTTKGATAPGQYGGTYTQTTGILEAINYVISTGHIVSSNINTKPIKLEGGHFVISSSNTVTATLSVNNIEIYAEGNVMGNIYCEYNSGYAFTFGDEFASTTFIFHSIGAVPGSGYTPGGFINISNSSKSVTWISYYFQVFAGFTTAGLNLNGFYSAYFYENQLAPSSNGKPSLLIENGRDVGFFGGSNYDVDVQSVNTLISLSSTFTGTVENVSYTAAFMGGSVDITGFSGTFGQVAFTGIVSTGIASLISINGTTSIKSFVVNGFYERNGTFDINYSLINNPNNYTLTIDNIKVDGIVTDSSQLPIGYYLTPTTPSVPTSATAQENTNPYAVDVYVYGGDVTEIQITRNGTAYTVLSVSTAIAMSGQAYKLNSGDSITVTYSTAPSWEWLSD